MNSLKVYLFHFTSSSLSITKHTDIIFSKLIMSQIYFELLINEMCQINTMLIIIWNILNIIFSKYNLKI